MSRSSSDLVSTLLQALSRGPQTVADLSLLVSKGGWEMSELLEDLAKRGLVRKEERRPLLPDVGFEGSFSVIYHLTRAGLTALPAMSRLQG